jgi:hypothetical protein
VTENWSEEYEDDGVVVHLAVVGPVAERMVFWDDAGEALFDAAAGDAVFSKFVEERVSLLVDAADA